MSFETKMVFTTRLKEKLCGHFISGDVEKILSCVLECLNGLSVVQQPTNILLEDELLSTYLNALRVQGRSKKTLDHYRYSIQRMLNAVAIPTVEITVHHLRSYLSKEKERGIDDGTLEGNRQVYSAYFNWLQREGLIRINPTANLGSIKCRKKVKAVYSEIDIEKLKQKCTNKRDRAIIAFLLSTACRVSEMIQLNIQDVDFVKLECTVLGKGDKERTVYLDSVAGMLLRAYLDERTDKEEALFVSLKQPFSRLQPGGVRQMLKELGILAGVDHVHPHKFRRTKATTLIKHGMSIQDVAAILGHDKLDTTMKYVVLNREDIEQSYRKHA